MSMWATLPMYWISVGARTISSCPLLWIRLFDCGMLAKKNVYVAFSIATLLRLLHSTPGMIDSSSPAHWTANFVYGAYQINKSPSGMSFLNSLLRWHSLRTENSPSLAVLLGYVCFMRRMVCVITPKSTFEALAAEIPKEAK